MVKERDPGWDGLRSEIERALAANSAARRAGQDTGPTSAQELAAAMGTSAELVRYWLAGRANPRFAQIPAIGEALQIGAQRPGAWDQLALPRAMNTIPETPTDGPELALAVQKLQSRFTRLQGQLVAAGSAFGAGGIVARAVELGTWAVAVWPALEGDADIRIHVADRIDFQRLDRAKITHDDVRADFEDALRSAGAIPGTAQPRWSSPDDDYISRWSILRVGAPHPSSKMNAWPMLPSLMVVSTTVRSWASDIASHLADALGYGLTSTREMAMDLVGVERGNSSTLPRDDMQRLLLQRPQVKRVWSHWSPNDPLRQGKPGTPPGITAAWLHESDDLLEREAAGPNCQFSLDELMQARSSGDAIAAEDDDVVRVDIEGSAVQTIGEIRNERFMESLRASASVIQQLVAAGRLPAEDIRRWWDSADGSRSDRERAVCGWMKRNADISSARVNARRRGGS